MTIRSDVGFEAAYLSAAVLLGLVHERDVPAWAEAHLLGAGPPALAEVLTAPVALSPIRAALQPLTQGADQGRVGRALLTTLAYEATNYEVADLVRVLGDLRRLIGTDDSRAAAIKTFEERAMLTSAGLTSSAPTATEIVTWLHSTRGPARFLVRVSDAREAAALVAALSRAVHRLGVEFGAAPSLDAFNIDHGRWLALGEGAWRVARDVFAPLPVESRIPFPIDVDADDESLATDLMGAGPLGLDEAIGLLERSTPP